MKGNSDFPVSDLASFDDRYTMRYVRTLPHAIERVWDAVTQEDQVNLWLMPVSEIEPRLGGRCRFSWGSPGASASDGEVLVFEPPRRVRYGTEAGGIEFQLTETDEGTRLTFLQLFSPDFRQDPMDDRPGGSLPAGADTPWRPGFVAGFHLALEELGPFIGRAWTEERIAGESARVVKIANEGGKAHFEADGDSGEWHQLVRVYEQIIREQCPPA